MANNLNKIEYAGRVFEQNQIKEGNLYLAMSLLSESLEVNTFEFDIASEDTTLVDFHRNDKVTYFYGGKQIGIFYLQSVQRTGAETYHFTAQSAIGLLMDGIHYGGIYEGTTLTEILPSICGNVPYTIKSNLLKAKLYGWLPVATPRDNLSQVLFAVGACVKTDLDGVLRIENLWDGVSGSAGKSRMYDDPNVDYAAKITQVVVTEHQYIPSNDEVQLFEGTTQQGDIITFDEPAHSLVATGFEILESGANYAKVTAAPGTLVGKKYTHNKRQIAKDIATAETPNIKKVEDATLVSLVNSEAVANRLVNYYAHSETIDAAVVYDGEFPGDILSTYHPYDKNTVEACVQSADITISNKLKSQEKSLVGFKPLQSEDVVLFEYREILTGSGEWTVPEGVASVRAVLIGAGEDGQVGSAANNAVSSLKTDSVAGEPFVVTAGTPQGTTITRSRSLNLSSTRVSATSGAPGGNGGNPGKVYEASIDVAIGSNISYNCGTRENRESVFGNLSSAEGAIAPNGYTDIMSGVTYAKKGQDGGAGANGGEAGQRGGSTDLASGGYASQRINNTKNPTWVDDVNGRSTSSTDHTPYTGRINLRASESGSTSSSGGGGAGGSSGGKAGSNGGTPQSGSIILNNGNVTVNPQGSGRGGDGAPGNDAAVYGCGGDGGGGAGGAGGIDACNLSIQTQESMVTNFDYTDGIHEIRFTQGYDSIQGTIQAAVNYGGYGGKAGKGAPGCIILYYGMIKKLKSGAVATRDGKLFLDKHGRRLVV